MPKEIIDRTQRKCRKWVKVINGNLSEIEIKEQLKEFMMEMNRRGWLELAYFGKPESIRCNIIPAGELLHYRKGSKILKENRNLFIFRGIYRGKNRIKQFKEDLK